VTVVSSKHPPVPIPAKEDLTEGEVAVVIHCEPDDFGRVGLVAFWLEDYLTPAGIRGQVFFANLAEFLARHERCGVKVRGLNAFSERFSTPSKRNPTLDSADPGAETYMCGDQRRKLADRSGAGVSTSPRRPPRRPNVRAAPRRARQQHRPDP
jgi:hypothetical protein